LAEQRGAVFTAIIHGTFSRGDAWWRLARSGAPPTFADRLEAALTAQGLVGTVWAPAIAAGMDEDDFAWSGINRHSERTAAGASLAAALDRLAAARGCTAEAPLRVNLIAHSHGGNVVLEALSGMTPRVRARRLIFLGTPLIERTRSLRLLRAVLAAVVLAATGAAVLFGIIGLTGAFIDPELQRDDWALMSFGLLVGAAFFGSWVFVALAALADLLWRVLCWPVDRYRQRLGQVYGPPPERVRQLTGGRGCLLVTSHYDEADILLQLGSRPRRLFDQIIRRSWPRSIQLLELIAVRPFIDWMAFHLVEMVLERLALGMTWLECLINDYRMADLDRSVVYPPTIYHRVDVTDFLEESLRAPQSPAIKLARAGESVEPSGPVPAGEGDPAQAPQSARDLREQDSRHLLDLYENIREVGRKIAEQVRFLHSRYYESDTVVRWVARELLEEQIDWSVYRKRRTARSAPLEQAHHDLQHDQQDDRRLHKEHAPGR